MADLHAQGIVHRDIKLENVMVRLVPEVAIKVIDFGLCEYEAKLPSASTNLVGSPGYIAPEIFAGMPQTTQVDLFSIGVLLYALISGSMPFNGKTQNETLKKNYRCELFFP
jgi:serine/threonine protein kinase